MKINHSKHISKFFSFNHFQDMKETEKRMFGEIEDMKKQTEKRILGEIEDMKQQTEKRTFGEIEDVKETEKRIFAGIEEMEEDKVEKRISGEIEEIEDKVEKTMFGETEEREDKVEKRIFGEIEEIEDEVERRFNRFKHFDIASHTPYDHHYLPYHHYLPLKIFSGSDFRRTIEQEWRNIDKNIPNSIFIRGYKERIDLMRAAIVAPPNGPYHNCLFFFDIFMPMDYPSSPPKIHYRSYGLNLGPNLRAGKSVGEETTMEWNPQECNLLHILHEIEKSIFGPNAISSKVFELTCEKMIRVMKKPLRGFEDLVAGHFRNRAHQILLRFKGKENDGEDVVNLFVSLFTLLEKNGAYCKHHLDFMRSRKSKFSAQPHKSLGFFYI